MNPRGWLDLLRSLGTALMEVLQAESAVLQQELGETGREAGMGAALLAAAGLVLFWFLGVLTLFLILLLAIWMPSWAAAGVVALLLALVAGTLAGLGWHRWKKLENPTETVRRRWQEHQSWWHGRLLAVEGEGQKELPEAEERDSPEETK